jgi:hypothetical protein
VRRCGDRRCGHTRRFITGLGHIAGHLTRGGYESGHCERCRALCTALMRHYWRSRLRLPAPPGPLPRRVFMRATARALIARAGSAQRGVPRLTRAALGAINIAVIASAADAHRHPAAPTRILPVGLLPHRTPHLKKQWTNSCSARITARRIGPIQAPHRRPGVRPRKSSPGPSSSFALCNSIANISHRIAKQWRDSDSVLRPGDKLL